ncbi:Outer membrane protein MIP (Macrophage infectivity potentiator) (Peptidyl-prolyl cis-trans isomerase) (PPIase) (Rotamase) [Durusdinium trenchii]|uniref:Outer membrane protein MIP (Macrophage infectivity potentiator) (Peptidyl-prolyl cis-trans isomerase) (PPIase) (Rotamase) n=1 Tax=Durusdinium trenchii TaxID=1381693 RepID=A0ABP0JZF7_9DINO
MPTDKAGSEFLRLKEGQPGVTKLPSGLMYKVLESGAGVKSPGPNTQCECHYSGQLIKGQQPLEFDSTYKRGKPLTFAPAQVIDGWKEVLKNILEARSVWKRLCSE